MDIRHLRTLYDSFEQKDMSFDDFVREFETAIKPPTQQEIIAVQAEQITKSKLILN